MHPQSTANIPSELLATAKTPRPVGERWTVSGAHGRVSYDQLGNHLVLIDANGDIDSMGKRWADQVAQAVDADDDEAVFALLAGHYGRELAGGTR